MNLEVTAKPQPTAYNLTSLVKTVKQLHKIVLSSESGGTALQEKKKTVRALLQRQHTVTETNQHT